MRESGADAALPDALMALAGSRDRRSDFSRPSGARLTERMRIFSLYAHINLTSVVICV